MIPFRAHWGRILLTLSMLACAIVLGRHLWDYYMNAPWTRDGRVRADVVRIAPEVSGTITEIAVVDNQFVRRGDVLYQIDPERFQLALQQAQANLDAKRQALQLRQSTARRRTELEGSGAETAESIEQAGSDATVARAEYRNATAALDVAKLNLERTTVRAPVDGYVTNLNLRSGNYAAAGSNPISLVDANSFRILGYFQETQVSRIHVGDPVEIRLMGFHTPLNGQVESFGRGIADGNTAGDHLGLPSVDPVFNWVRLAQRIPVRIRIGQLPDGLILASGMTASVYVQAASDGNSSRTAARGEAK
ncbi:HlyD family secretion protein|uniref:efflux RND transporter periplasmic adaptor subunit n=1 Tax=Stenotrophomonas sp. SbOxS2 TaxID=2723885 RepID=UPI0015D3F526|nr:HlyD family secretion protein [Stenotrophomonas sp. SbOxS2]NYT99368.1 HlyD family secretion protein [Stenotrophomonas sp. SbOxS2]